MPMFVNLAKILPEVEAADLVYWQEIDSDDLSNETYAAACAKYNAVLGRAVDAIYEDTKHVNSLKTLQQAFAAPGIYDTMFGQAPYVFLSQVVEKDSFNVR